MLDMTLVPNLTWVVENNLIVPAIFSLKEMVREVKFTPKIDFS